MYEFNYGLKEFIIVLQGKKSKSIIITRMKSKNIRAAQRDVLQQFSNTNIVSIKFNRYER